MALGNYPEEPLFYLRDNIGHHRPDGTGDEWAIIGDASSGLGEKWMRTPASQKIQRLEPWPSSPVPITPHPVKEAYDSVLAHAGATTPRRDAVDSRVVNDVRMEGGRCIDDPSEVGGWPTLEIGVPPLDTDHDGMPDEWETRHKLDPNNPDDRNANAPSGYTWVEEYINSLISISP